MDWTFPADLQDEPTFYDVWVTREMTGESLFGIPVETGRWGNAWNLLRNDPKALKRLYAHRSFQVFSCWNGATVFTAKRLLERKIKFRSFIYGECVQGELQLFCNDMWYGIWEDCEGADSQY